MCVCVRVWVCGKGVMMMLGHMPGIAVNDECARFACLLASLRCCCVVCRGRTSMMMMLGVAVVYACLAPIASTPLARIALPV